MADTHHKKWRETLHSPVLELLGLRPARPTWRRLIADAGLPDDIKRVITDVIKRARLWRYESADVADELIAHFHDGLDAGQSADDLIKKFGDTKTAAKLIKRAKMRSRPLLWRAARRCAHATLALIGVYFLAAVWLSFSQPELTVDYIAIVNQNADAAPESDRAWPIYRKAFIACDLANSRTRLYPLFGKNVRPTMPGDPEWETTNKPLLTKFQSLVEAARLASEKPMGLRLNLRSRYNEEDRLALFGNKSPYAPGSEPSPSRAMVDESLIRLHRSSMGSSVSLLLVNDMADAAGAHDADRVLSDYRAALSLARQTREVETLGNQVSAMGDVSTTHRSLAVILEKYPALFSREQLTTLAHLAVGANETCRINMSCERAAYLDLIQRIYSDDGHGNGRVTRKGLLAMPELASAWTRDLPPGDLIVPRMAIGIAPSSTLPVIVFTTADRREMTDFVQHHFDELDAMAGLPMWELAPRIEAAGRKLDAVNADPAAHLRLRLVLDRLPQLAPWFRTSGRVIAFNEAVAVAISLEIYRRDHGQYPAELASLVPQYFPRTPLDHSTGKPLLYKIQDGKPLLYGRGRDGSDHGGTPGAIECWPCVPQTGDWVLYPLPDVPWS